MHAAEGAIRVACRRVGRLQKMKLRSLVGMLLHRGGELPRISFSRSRVLSESHGFVEKRGRRSREEHRRMYHSDMMQGAVFEEEFQTHATGAPLRIGCRWIPSGNREPA